MPQNSNNFPHLRRASSALSLKPPEAMTRAESLPIIVFAGVFDAIRFMFELFVFFGPALAALLCTVGVNSTIGTTLAETGGKVVAAGCTVVAGVAGFFGAPWIESFGLVMSDITGLIAFLILGLGIMLSNRRLLKAVASAPWQFAGAFAISEVPFVGAIPVFSIILWRLYGAQIRTEQAALKKWKSDHAAELLRQHQQQAAEITKARNAQAVQMQQREAANDEKYAEAEQEKYFPEAANDARYEPAPARVIPRLARVPNYTGTTQGAANDERVRKAA